MDASERFVFEITGEIRCPECAHEQDGRQALVLQRGALLQYCCVCCSAHWEDVDEDAL